jgi:uncharacterized protein (DUF58 family)
MIKKILPSVLVLIVVAAFVRDDFAFTLIYLLVGVYALGIWWSNRALAAVSYKRSYDSHVFLGTEFTVDLEVTNQGLLPIPWLRLHEGLSVELKGPKSHQRVISLGPRAVGHYRYALEGRKRGYYSIGPLYLSSGDIFGMISSDLRREYPAQYVTVYPKIIPLTHLDLHSRSPTGTLRHTQPIFEDPSRVLGKRDYVAGDSLRWVDWKTTASTGRMQVKVFEPSIALEAMIFLNLNVDEYHLRTRAYDTELAIIIAASIANWITNKQQTLGLRVNGIDPLVEDGSVQNILPRKGRSHLMRVLEILARVQSAECPPLAAMVRQQCRHFAWGTTLVVITGLVDDDLLDELYQARRAGLNINLILSGTIPDRQTIFRRAGVFGIPVTHISHERDMDMWRQ